MSMPISHPWLAPRSLRIARTEGGTQTREECSPSLDLLMATVAAGTSDASTADVCCRLLIMRQLRTHKPRGVLCRASDYGESANTVVRQPGRERPPLPPPEPGPEPCSKGVAHAPAACLVRPDEWAFAHVVDTTRCRTHSRPPARRAQRLEAVTTVALTFLNGRAPCH